MHVNYVAVLVGGVLQFLLGGLWYSPVMFAKKWVALLGKSEEELKKGMHAMMYPIAFITGLISSYVLANIINFAGAATVTSGAIVGFMCWLGFTGTTSYNNQVNFVGRPAMLWAIDSGYNLVGFILTGAILAVWK